MNTLRALTLLFLILFGSMSHAASSTGIWSSNEGYYLVLMEQSSTGSVVAMAVSPSYKTGMVFTGPRSGDVISLQSVDKTSTMKLTLSGQTYTGTFTMPSSTLSLSGNLLLAYAGNPNDGIWQKTDGSSRYLSTITVTSNGSAITVLLDVTIPTTSGSTITYDVAPGSIPSSSYTFVGASLVSSNAITLAFTGSASPTASYKASTTSRPITTVEQFDVTKIFSLN